MPVPMHPRRLRERGCNHAALLAEAAAKGLELQMVEALARTRNTRQQARLDVGARLTNQEGAFALTRDVSGRRILLVDDVRTTGATANACARTLWAGGATAIYLLCFAEAREDGE